jgi:hypothetical protein
MFIPSTYTYLFNLSNILTNKKTPEKRGALERLSWRRDRLKWNPIYMTVAGCSPYKRAYKKAPPRKQNDDFLSLFVLYYNFVLFII